MIQKKFYGEGEIRIGGTDAGSYLYTRDHLGSVREVMSLDGVLQARYDYDAYGKRMTITQNLGYLDGCDFGYTGHFTRTALVAGKTELVLAHYRAYDPALGRWLSEDPLGIEGGMNLYGYVGNDPLNFYDPDGLDAQPVPGHSYNRWIGDKKAIVVGMALRWPGEGYDNQCAAAAQHQAGPSGHDAPSVSAWERGDPVGPNTPYGTMLATGWVKDPSKSRGYEYPNKSNITNPGASNHTVIFLRVLPNGQLLVRHQSIGSKTKRGRPVHDAVIDNDAFHEVWTPKTAKCPPSMGKWGAPL